MAILSGNLSETTAGPQRTWVLWIARVLWFGVLLTVAAVYWAMIPDNMRETRYEWVVQESMDAVAPHLSFTLYVQMVVLVEYIVIAVYVGSALLIFAKGKNDPFVIFVSAALLLLSVNFGISSNMDTLRLPLAIDGVIPWLEPLLPALILGSFALLYLLLPNGRFAPPWLAWVAIPSLLGLLVASYSLFNDSLIALVAPLMPAASVDTVWILLLALILLPLVIVLPIRLMHQMRTQNLVSRGAGWLWLALGIPLTTLAALIVAWRLDADDELGWLIFTWTLLTPMLLGFLSQIYRYTTESDAVRRQQIKWLAWGLASPLLGLLFGLLLRALLGDDALHLALENLYYPLLTTLIPLSILFSIFRYQLWGIDRLLNRTMVYGALTMLIATLYVVLVGLLSTTVGNSSGLMLSVALTGLIALLFQPLRQALQRLANRLIYGERDDPATVLTRLGRRLEDTVAPEAVPSAIVETVTQALKLPYAELTLEQDGRTLSVAAQGVPMSITQSFALVYQGETLGHLAVAPRSPGESLTAADLRLLDDIAHQAGPALHALRLTEELQRSRAEIITAREEERRRLRRDLHDGLGPQLASMTMKIDAACHQLRSDPAIAEKLLSEYKQESQEALADLRRLVYGLRPPALDQLGLVSALRDHATARGELGGLAVDVITDGELPPLSAAAEVAAYRIALEALTNVAHHARATSCHIMLWADDAFHMTITDDGNGIEQGLGAGVGLSSMRERAEELGGSCVIAALPDNGTRVTVRLPLTAPSLHS